MLSHREIIYYCLMASVILALSDDKEKTKREMTALLEAIRDGAR